MSIRLESILVDALAELRAERELRPQAPVDPDAYAAAVMARAAAEVDAWCQATGKRKHMLACEAWPDAVPETARSRYARAMKAPVDVEKLTHLANAMGVHVSVLFATCDGEAS